MGADLDFRFKGLGFGFRVPQESWVFPSRGLLLRAYSSDEDPNRELGACWGASPAPAPGGI